MIVAPSKRVEAPQDVCHGRCTMPRSSVYAMMLLCQGGLLVGIVEVGDEQGKQGAGDVAHQAAADLLGALALGGAAGDVVAGLGVMDHAVVGDQPERAVALAVAAAVEAVPRRLAA